MLKPEKIRNIAIIAHIDHGKTTLLDSLLRQSAIFQDHEKIPERVMDSNDQEKERGITISSKHTSILFNDFKINIIDTPGHADFSGDVERVLRMVNSVLLLVDAREGPMPQTRFVLMKSLEIGHKPIVILNKIDRPHANPDRALDLTFDLFTELGATDEQLDFNYCYASGLNGFAMKNINDPRENMRPLFELICEAVPVPPGDLNKPFLMQVATIGYDDYIGRQACGRIVGGSVKKGDTVYCQKLDGTRESFRVTRVEGHHGLKKVEMDVAGVGDIISVSGFENVTIGDLLCNEANTEEMPPISLEDPTLSIDIMVNSGPFAGKDGKHLTMNKIRDRLMREKRTNVSLAIEESTEGTDKITVSGRGELHLAVLIESMRREGFELIVSKPKVIIKNIDGVKSEPIENAHIEVPNENSGSVIEALGKRRGEMQSLDTDEHGIARMNFMIPTRGLMGYRNEFLSATKGLGIMTSVFDHYAPWKGEIPGRKRGVMIAMGAGMANGYACFGLQSRSSLFVIPGDEVYEGMVVGENSRENDMVVNITKPKQLTNVRASGKDDAIVLTPAKRFTLEEAIDFIDDDEFVEVTPLFVRLRKMYLTENERKRLGKKKS